MPILHFKNFAELERLVEEQTEEGSFLEFKSSRIFEKELKLAADDLSKEITAFANGGGGTLIIGIDETSEERSKASSVAGTVDKKINSERLQQLLDTRISPPIPNLEITEIEDKAGGVCFVVAIPLSDIGPHQASDLKYYARRQYQKLPMEHYEIEDIRNRWRVSAPRISLRIEFSKQVFTELVVENISKDRLTNISFHISSKLKGIFKWEAPALKNGITNLNSGEKFSYNLGSIFELFKNEILKQDNYISVKFSDKFGKIYEEEIVFNLLNHDGSSFVSSEIDFLREKIVEHMKKTTGALEKIGEVLDQHLTPLTSNTGLRLSQTTLEHLEHIKSEVSDQTIWNPLVLDVQAIQEILKCDRNEARQLYSYFRWERGRDGNSLEDLEGVCADILVRAAQRLVIPGEKL